MSVTLPAPAMRAVTALRAYHSEANEEALIERNLPLVRTTVDRMRIYLPAALDMDDLYSVGFTGLAAAARKFDPGQGVPFSAFASLHIRGAVHDELRRMDWTPRTIREKAKKFSESLSALEQRLGRPASEEEVCRELSLKREDYESMLDEIRPASFVPLDGEAYSEDAEHVALHEIIADDSQVTGRDELQKKELLALVAAQIQKLPDMQKKVLAMYYFEGMRLAEIAQVFGVTEGRISQINTQAVLSLRAFIKRADTVPAAA
jgi:RNA polymerase sigma factor for flagellar operon FliA